MHAVILLTVGIEAHYLVCGEKGRQAVIFLAQLSFHTPQKTIAANDQYWLAQPLANFFQLQTQTRQQGARLHGGEYNPGIHCTVKGQAVIRVNPLN